MDQSVVDSFTGITGASADQAQFYLESANGDLETAVSTYFESGAGATGGAATAAATDDDDADVDMAQGAGAGSGPAAARDEQAELEAALAASAASSGPRTLGGGPAQSSTAVPSDSAPRAATGGAYTLSGERAEPLPAGWGSSAGSSRSHTPSSSSRLPSSNSGPRVTGFRDLAGSSSGPSSSKPRGNPKLGRVQHGGDDSAGSRGESDDDDQQEFFAGGEKSGLSVQNPNSQGAGGLGQAANDFVKGILQKAKEGGERVRGMADSAAGGSSSQPAAFVGGGHTLGSDETPSTFIPPATNQRAGGSGSRAAPGAFPFGGGAADDSDDEMDHSNDEPAIRNLTFWQDGFSIEDGDLMSYDDPANQEILRAIDSGRAPLSLLKVNHDQPVELRIAKRSNEKWTRQPPPPRGPFEGAGHRLGAEAPDLTSATATPTSARSAPAPSSDGTGAAGGISTETQFELDNTAPITTLQIRLRDGERMIARFNHTHTIGDVRRYIDASRPGAQGSYALQTTFPSKDLTDDKATLEQAGVLGSVIVQRGL